MPALVWMVISARSLGLRRRAPAKRCSHPCMSLPYTAAWSKKSMPASRAVRMRVRMSSSGRSVIRIRPSTTLGAAMSPRLMVFKMVSVGGWADGRAGPDRPLTSPPGATIIGHYLPLWVSLGRGLARQVQQGARALDLSGGLGAIEDHSTQQSRSTSFGVEAGVRVPGQLLVPRSGYCRLAGPRCFLVASGSLSMRTHRQHHKTPTNEWELA